MPHTNISGDNIISLQHAKIAQKNFTVLSDVNLNIKKVDSAILSEKQVPEKAPF